MSVFRPNVEIPCVDFHFGLSWSILNGRRGDSLEVIDDRIVIERASIWQWKALETFVESGPRFGRSATSSSLVARNRQRLTP